MFLARGQKDARLREIHELARGAGVSVRLVGQDELDRLVREEPGERTARHQGIAAKVAERPYAEAADCLAGEKGWRLAILLDEVTDPANLGSVLRTAAAFGASVLLPERHTVGLTASVVKTAAGAIERVKVARIGNTARFLEDAKAAGFWIYGADPEGETLDDVDFSGDALICLGSEGAGLRRLTREGCDRLVAIPMEPGAGSLNVGVAGAVVLYEVQRQRRRAKKVKGDPGPKAT